MRWGNTTWQWLALICTLTTVMLELSDYIVIQVGFGLAAALFAALSIHEELRVPKKSLEGGIKKGMGALKAAGVFLVVVLLAAIGYAAWDYWSEMQATVVGIDVYVDETIWTHGMLVDWGNVSKGMTYSMNLTVVNNLDIAQIVNVYSHNLPSYFTFTWGANGSIVQAYDTIFDWLNLTVSATAPSGTVNWNWNVTGTP